MGSVRQVLTSPRSEFAARVAGLNLVAGMVGSRGQLRTSWGADVFGTGEVDPGTAVVALFRPSAVAVHLDPPYGSPRNVIAVKIAGLDLHGSVVRVRGSAQPDGGAGLTADITAAAAADLDLEPGKTVYEEITQGDEEIEIAGRKLKSRAYVARFNFRGSDQQKEVGKLSGGERNRVHLAKLLRRSGNVLLLDEPTNDLDVTTLSNLENAILNFNGCVLVISHDRFFLDRICTHLLVFEGDSKVRWFEGNFEEYQQVRKKELGGREENRRSKYKKLTLH